MYLLPLTLTPSLHIHGIGIAGAPGLADQFFLTTRLSAPDFKGASEQPGFIVIFRLT